MNSLSPDKKGNINDVPWIGKGVKLRSIYVSRSVWQWDRERIQLGTWVDSSALFNLISVQRNVGWTRLMEPTHS